MSRTSPRSLQGLRVKLFKTQHHSRNILWNANSSLQHLGYWVIFWLFTLKPGLMPHSESRFDRFNFWLLHMKNNDTFEAQSITTEMDDWTEYNYYSIITASVLATGNTTFHCTRLVNLMAHGYPLPTVDGCKICNQGCIGKTLWVSTLYHTIQYTSSILMRCHRYSASDMHSFTRLRRFGFSRAAATLSLSLICFVTAKNINNHNDNTSVQKTDISTSCTNTTKLNN